MAKFRVAVTVRWAILVCSAAHSWLRDFPHSGHRWCQRVDYCSRNSASKAGYCSCIKCRRRCTAVVGVPTTSTARVRPRDVHRVHCRIVLGHDGGGVIQRDRCGGRGRHESVCKAATTDGGRHRTLRPHAVRFCVLLFPAWHRTVCDVMSVIAETSA